MTNLTVENKPYQAIPQPYPHKSFCRIWVKGQLDDSWSEWLEGLEVKLLENGEMMLFGQIADQAALMGILNKLNGLNLALLSMSIVGSTKSS